jgi:hypothetical protein
MAAAEARAKVLSCIFVILSWKFQSLSD